MPRLSTFRITKRAVDDLKTDRDAIYFDGDLRGFAVRTKPSGSKSYLVQYEMDGRTRRVTLGAHGQLTPAQARERAAVMLGQIRAGQNPAEARRSDRQAVNVRRLTVLYLEAAEQGLILGKKGLSKKSSTLSVDRGRIERHILPLLGQRLVQDLKAPDIVRFMRDVAAGKTAADVKTGLRGRSIVTGGKGTASRTVGLLGGILSFAVSEGIVEQNVARGVQRPADRRRVIRLSKEEFQQLGAAIAAAEAAAEAWQPMAMIRMLALTGCRRGEIERLRWCEVDIAGRALRLGDSKTGASVRPLGSAARVLLDNLPRTGEFVFPAMRGPAPADDFYKSLPKAWNRTVKEGGDALSSLSPHGLRHAFASVAHDLGYTELTIAALLGHASTSVTGRYVHHVDDALVGAADRVAGFIAGAMGQELGGSCG